MVAGGKRIGVLGGIGPESSAEFYEKLVKEIQKKGLIRTNRDFPQIIINSIPATELIYDTISDKDLEPYVKGLKELDRAKVDFIVMVCNTIHLYHDNLQRKISTPVIDLRKELRRLLIIRGVKKLLVLGTPSTVRKGLYEFSGIKSIYPNDNDLKKLTGSIFNFNKGLDKDKQCRIVKGLCRKYLKNKPGLPVMLGCTEFAVMLGNEDFNSINTIDVLVESTINKCLST